ncbi:MAG TPA: phage tail sheath subtilisin-like domain-containing protein [Pyrinomonadaceae bacterium]|nr:phage tail sheath subtilisin-like domain-containing protein [Pyrinomonadaceae bacterium]
MTVYRTPGVYFERRDVSPLTIGLPRSDIAGFAGIAMRGPLFEPVRIESWIQFISTFGTYIPQAYLAYSVYGFFANGGRTCWISRVADPTMVRTASRDFGGVTVTAGSPGSWGNGIYVRPFVSSSTVTALLVRFPDGQEQFLRAPFNPSPAPRDNLLQLSQEQIDRKVSALPLVFVAEEPFASGLPEPGFLEGGADGLTYLEPSHFELAFERLDEVPEIGVVAAPDLMPKLPIAPMFKQPPLNCCCVDDGVPTPQIPAPDTTEFPPPFGDDQIQDLQIALTTHVQGLRYRFAILDAAGERAVPPQAISWRNVFPESSFAALYYPWILVDDPLRLTGVVRAIPPSGHVAGIYARSDQRKGVHKPPMNEVLEAVSDVRFPVDETDHGELNETNVNTIRVMPGRGVRVMGARTLWRDLLFRYINVRRLLSTIEKALEQSLQWTVFEPNNPLLWREIDRVVRCFLEDLFRKGMLDGATSEEAYSVRCDEATNPPSETDLGRMICEIGIKPPYPAEFVVVILGITKDGIQIREAREQHA